MKIAVLGIGTTKFGELWEVSPRILVNEAVNEALRDAKLNLTDIEALFVGNMLSGILGNQENLGALFADELGLSTPAFKIEGACASGGLAVHNAVNSILAGTYKTCLVVGIEKMTDHKPEEISQALMAAGHEEERTAGLTFPGLYAILAQAYMEKYKITEKELAAISIKNHYHASLNPKAQFPFEICLEKVLKSAKIADPLRLLHCSPISDGAAAIILSEDRRQKTEDRKPVFIIASTVATDSLGLAGRKDLTSLRAAVEAGKKAYQEAGVSPADIDVAEVHDCFSIAEIMACEDLGFFEKGKAALEIVKGKTKLGKGRPVINPSGGLKACGHPVGATGVKQIGEIVSQLREEAGKRQVKGAKIGLTHNVGGSGAVAVIHILSNS
ncbi:thiolase domain-containing protein [Candidatus Gottesmanbacteria bacterium]|nr:thiolase domain-containing protein [Candidatus Gottesmanbacteria bacterium]